MHREGGGEGGWGHTYNGLDQASSSYNVVGLTSVGLEGVGPQSVVQREEEVRVEDVRPATDTAQ